jgi:hypothetical protein
MVYRFEFNRQQILEIIKTHPDECKCNLCIWVEFKRTHKDTRTQGDIKHNLIAYQHSMEKNYIGGILLIENNSFFGTLRKLIIKINPMFRFEGSQGFNNTTFNKQDVKRIREKDLMYLHPYYIKVIGKYKSINEINKKVDLNINRYDLSPKGKGYSELPIVLHKKIASEDMQDPLVKKGEEIYGFTSHDFPLKLKALYVDLEPEECILYILKRRMDKKDVIDIKALDEASKKLAANYPPGTPQNMSKVNLLACNIRVKYNTEVPIQNPLLTPNNLSEQIKNEANKEEGEENNIDEVKPL